jgi:hypothetical protein
MPTRSVLLLATNKSEYLEFAKNCAASITLHNPGLPVFIITNIKVEEKLTNVKFIPISEEIANLAIEGKLYINDYIQTEESLFIDSDCLCFGNLNPIFNACKDIDVTVVGRTISLENYWGRGAAFAAKEFNIDRSILFNGGLYFIRDTALMRQIFNKARSIAEKYDEYGFTRIQNKWKNEEDLLSIGMISNKQLPIADDGRFYTDLFTDRRPKVLNVLTGQRVLRNPAHKGVEQKREYYPDTYSPLIIHFGGNSIKSYPYLSQSSLLKLKKNGVPVYLASLLVYLFIDTPYKAYHFSIRTLRKFVP